MVTKEEIKQINELAKKSKKEGLNEEEKKLQQALRQKYIESVRNSFKNQMKSIKVVDPAGNDITPKKVQDLKNKDS